jgi:hypothetical protein
LLQRKSVIKPIPTTFISYLIGCIANQIGVGPEPWRRQCDDANSSPELLVQRLRVRLRRERSSL